MNESSSLDCLGKVRVVKALQSMNEVTTQEGPRDVRYALNSVRAQVFVN